MDVKNSKNRGLKSIVIDEEQYHNLLNMLNSNEEDQLVALTCIKGLDKERNSIAVAFLRKSGKCHINMWRKHCKSWLDYMDSLKMKNDSNVITFSTIYKALKKETKYQKENAVFFITRYTEYIKKDLLRATLQSNDFVEDIEINIKIKGYEQ